MNPKLLSRRWDLQPSDGHLSPFSILLWSRSLPRSLAVGCSELLLWMCCRDSFVLAAGCCCFCTRWQCNPVRGVGNVSRGMVPLHSRESWWWVCSWQLLVTFPVLETTSQVSILNSVNCFTTCCPKIHLVWGGFKKTLQSFRGQICLNWVLCKCHRSCMESLGRKA